jgi:hypothetical protein
MARTARTAKCNPYGGWFAKCVVRADARDQASRCCFERLTNAHAGRAVGPAFCLGGLVAPRAVRAEIGRHPKCISFAGMA